MSIKETLYKAAVELAYSGPLRNQLLPRYGYMFSPSQLALLVRMADEALKTSGIFMEIGCARGSTTIHLNKHLDFRSDVRRYVCIDTFKGFIEADIRHEVSARGKDEAYLKRSFAQNRKSWFDHTMKINGMERVETIEAPVQEVDLATVAGEQGVAFALVDVDLYLPVKDALARVWPLMSPGGVIVVDDCDEKHATFDGAFHAYQEFASEHGLEPLIEEVKLGILRKPRGA
jgi:O-methyltransferase